MDIDIDRISAMLSPIFEKHNVKRAVLFGSYAKGKASDTSDIDILVDSGLRGLAFYGLLDDVVNVMHIPVDLIDTRQVKPDSGIKQEIERTGIEIYG